MCQLGAGVWVLGEMELRVGSNIIINFLYILLASHMAHVLVYYYTLLAVIIIYIYVGET